MTWSSIVGLAVVLFVAGCRDAPGERTAADLGSPLDPALQTTQPLAADLDAQIKSVVDRAFQSLGSGRKGWTVLTTPAIPSQWPPNGEIFVYAYGASHDPMVMDGEHSGDVWARVVITGAGLRVEKLAAELSDLGIQGVEPVMRDEMDQHQAALRQRRQELLAATGVAGLDQSAFSQTYQQWQRWNGLIAKAIGARHPEFFSWAGLQR